MTAEPAVRELPSGDHLVIWRISVTRPIAEQRPKQPADTITCVSFDPSMQQAARDWRIGDVIEVTGALRRRFWRSSHGSSSVFEVEAKTATRINLAAEAETASDAPTAAQSEASGGHQPS
ncbi:single-stranded DNA-binding protein [Salinactinospora qingdaonensis]|uniref:single-stranded DNA-binding protein n=1 Tax=Salinactinospora qingdaonensis TaxID=702744 RepID=UPI003CD06FBA